MPIMFSKWADSLVSSSKEAEVLYWVFKLLSVAYRIESVSAISPLHKAIWAVCKKSIIWFLLEFKDGIVMWEYATQAFTKAKVDLSCFPWVNLFASIASFKALWIRVSVTWSKFPNMPLESVKVFKAFSKSLPKSILWMTLQILSAIKFASV